MFDSNAIELLRLKDRHDQNIKKAVSQPTALTVLC
jgi:hypothetical protein